MTRQDHTTRRLDSLAGQNVERCRMRFLPDGGNDLGRPGRYVDAKGTVDFIAGRLLRHAPPNIEEPNHGNGKEYQ